MGQQQPIEIESQLPEPAREEKEQLEVKLNGTIEIEAITRSWTKVSLYTIWAGLITLNIAFLLDLETTNIYANYATSDFKHYSLLATLQVVQGVAKVCTRPILTKVIDVFGRIQGFTISIFSSVLGVVLLAVSPGINLYFAGQIFTAIGQVSWNYMMNSLAFDSSDMVNRTLMSSVVNFGNLFVPWTIGPITTSILKTSTWRWGIGMWSIVIPVTAIPLFGVLLYNKRKIKKLGMVDKVHVNVKYWKTVLVQFDIGGSILLGVGLALIFLAIPIASKNSQDWTKPYIIVMIILGMIMLVAFFVYEYYVPQYPILMYNLMNNRQIITACLFTMLDFLGQFIYTPYFFAWLMVVFDVSNTTATNVSRVSEVAKTASSIIGALLVKYSRRLKWILVFGCAVKMIGVGLIFAFRHEGTSTAKLFVAQIVDGIGSGLMDNPNMIIVQSYCRHSEVAQAMGLYHTFVSFGQIIGDAISGSVYRKYFKQYLQEAFPTESEKWIMNIYDNYTQSLKYPMGSPERHGIIKSLNKVMRNLLIPPLAIYGLMLLMACTYTDIRLDGINDGLQGVIFGRSSKKVKRRSGDGPHSGDDK